MNLILNLLIVFYVIVLGVCLIGYYYIRPRWPEWWKGNIADDDPEQTAPTSIWPFEASKYQKMILVEITARYEMPNLPYRDQSFPFSQNEPIASGRIFWQTTISNRWKKL